MEKVPLTAKGFAKLDAELKKLKSVERPAIIAAIAEAREHGDLSENAEYHAARERQSFVEGRIRELEGLIGRSEVIDPSRLSGPIKFGATVVLIDEDNDEEKTYQIVGEQEASIEHGLLNLKSPLARALIGKEPGDSVEVRTPGRRPVLRDPRGQLPVTPAAAGAPMARLRGLGDRLRALPRARRWAAGASLVWAVVVLAYAAGFLAVAAGGQGRGTLFLDAMFFLLTLTVPLVLVWIAAWLAEELAAQRALVAALADAALPLAAALEAARTRADKPAGVTPEAMQRAVQAAVAGLKPPDLGRPLDRLIIGQSRIESALQRLAVEPRPALQPGFADAPAPAPSAPAPVAPEPSAAAPPERPAPAPEEAEPERPSWPDLVRALDFPRDADDRRASAR